MDSCKFYLTILLFCVVSVQHVTCQLVKGCDGYHSDTQEYWKSLCGLMEVPDNIPAQVKKVRLCFNKISDIPDGAFRHLSVCTWLDLQNNKLTEVRVGAFQGLVSLRLLSLQRNKIRLIERGALQGLTSMKQLDLSVNKLITLEERWFTTPLQTTLELGLHDNPLQCDQRMCWIKQAVREEHITWDTFLAGPTGSPQCANYQVIDWDDVNLDCTEPECYRASSNTTQCPEGQFCFSAYVGVCTQAVRCSTSSDCSSTPGSSCGGGYCQPVRCSTTGQCVHGFTCNSGTCVDIDECEEDASLCENGRCINTAGSYECDCDWGYRYNQTAQICDGKPPVAIIVVVCGGVVAVVIGVILGYRIHRRRLKRVHGDEYAMADLTEPLKDEHLVVLASWITNPTHLRKLGTIGLKLPLTIIESAVNDHRRITDASITVLSVWQTGQENPVVAFNDLVAALKKCGMSQAASDLRKHAQRRPSTDAETATPASHFEHPSHQQQQRERSQATPLLSDHNSGLASPLNAEHIFKLSEWITSQTQLMKLGIKGLNLPSYTIETALTNNKDIVDAAYKVLSDWRDAYEDESEAFSDLVVALRKCGMNQYASKLIEDAPSRPHQVMEVEQEQEEQERQKRFRNAREAFQHK